MYLFTRIAITGLKELFMADKFVSKFAIAAKFLQWSKNDRDASTSRHYGAPKTTRASQQFDTEGFKDTLQAARASQQFDTEGFKDTLKPHVHHSNLIPRGLRTPYNWGESNLKPMKKGFNIL